MHLLMFFLSLLIIVFRLNILIIILIKHGTKYMSKLFLICVQICIF